MPLHPNTLHNPNNNPNIKNKIKNNASKIFNNLSLDSFFSLNEIPSLKKYPHFESFKEDEIKIKGQFKNGEFKNGEFKIGESIIKFHNSKAFIKLFNGYFNLFEFHQRIFENYPEIFEKFLSVILKIFSSMEKKKIEIMIKEICSNNLKMYEFYIEMYKIWEEERNNKEKEILLRE